jgi:hypothetical protein
MFIGHPATGFAAKRLAPAASLGILFVAPIFLDLLWPFFLRLGIEQVRIDPGNTAFTPLDFTHYPWSHSLLMAVVWSVVFGAAYRMWKADTRGAVVAGALVLSHWVLDFVVHRPDLPLYLDRMKVGLGLWNFVLATLVLELTMFAGGLALYLRATRAKDRTGRWALVALVAFLLVLYASVVLGPPPPSIRTLALMGLVAWLLPLWAWWVDRHREPRSAPPEPSLAKA